MNTMNPYALRTCAVGSSCHVPTAYLVMKLVDSYNVLSS